MAIIDRSHPDRISIISNPCARCGGTGEVSFINDTFSPPRADSTFCGICGGTGSSISRFDTVGAQSTPIPASRHFADGISSVRSSGRSRKH